MSLDLRSRLERVAGARQTRVDSPGPRAPSQRPASAAPVASGAGPFTTEERRIALDDLGLEVVGRGAPDPRTLAHLGLRGPAPAAWEDILFLDTETTGLAGGTGTYVFLLGTACLTDGELVLRQHLLHDLGAESAFVGLLAAELAGFHACASYNGKCFDLPLLRARVMLTLRTDLNVDDAHLDLLHPARRLWRGRFGSTSLRQIEDSVLDQPRKDDIPGALIPERFFRWMRSRDDSLIRPVLTHNARDLLSLVRIADHVARTVVAARAGRTPDHPAAALSLGRVFERQGDLATALLCYESAYVDGDTETRLRAALPYAGTLERRGRVERAAAMLETLLDLGVGTRAWRLRAEARVRRLRRPVRSARSRRRAIARESS